MLAHADTNYWITWFPGAVLATLGVLTLCWKGVSWLVNGINAFKQVQKVLPSIQAEFSPNSGHSMKDRVEAMHSKVDQLAYDSGKWQRQHARDDDRRFEKLDAGLERIEDKLTP